MTRRQTDPQSPRVNHACEIEMKNPTDKQWGSGRTEHTPAAPGRPQASACVRIRRTSRFAGERLSGSRSSAASADPHSGAACTAVGSTPVRSSTGSTNRRYLCRSKFRPASQPNAEPSDSRCSSLGKGRTRKPSEFPSFVPARICTKSPGRVPA